MSAEREILVLAEHRRGELRDVTLEMLTLGKSLAAKSGYRLSAVLLADQAQDLSAKLVGWADRVYTVDNARFANFNSELYQLALSELIRRQQPALTLIGHTAFGVDLAPALATALGLPLASDCLGFDFDGATLKVTRTVYGGKLNCDSRVRAATSYLATVRPAAFTPAAPTYTGKVEALSLTVPDEVAYRKFIEYVEAAVGDVDITKSDIVIGVGRGIKEQKNMPIVEELAKALGGVLACSRPVVDAGWLPKERQVGSSGKSVKPKLYIAIGISGAFQHVAGMKAAQTIIAINKDRNAPIFAEAHYGIVDDLFKVVPMLKEKIAALKGSLRI